MRSPLHAALAVPMIVTATLVACSSSDTGGTDSGTSGGGGDATTSGTTSGTSTSTSQATTTATAGGGGDCSTEATFLACDECECAKHQAGCDAYFAIEDEKCACGPGTPCETACTAYCAGGDFDPTCGACWEGLTGDEPCFEAIDTDCMADPACKEFVDASDASCAGLP